MNLVLYFLKYDGNTFRKNKYKNAHLFLLKEPRIQEKEKYFCCCCCKSGPMTMVVFVPYSGFVPGQSIPVTIEVDNNTNVDIDSIKIRLDRVFFLKIKFK